MWGGWPNRTRDGWGLRKWVMSPCPLLLSPVFTARSPTRQLNSACHQDMGPGYLSSAYMYFNLKICHPAPLAPVESLPHPHRLPLLREALPVTSPIPGLPRGREQQRRRPAPPAILSSANRDSAWPRPPSRSLETLSKCSSAQEETLSPQPSS